MSNFFVPDEVYNKRISICKDCKFYSNILGNCKICGCFMKLKARISSMSCPKGYWTLHDFRGENHIKTKDIPKQIINEVKNLYPHIKNGKADSQESKRKMIELYNIIYGADFDTRTSCSGCVSTCFSGIMKIYKENEKL